MTAAGELARSPTSSPKPKDPSPMIRKRKASGNRGSSSNSAGSLQKVSAATLPREVLHSIFSSIFTDDRTAIYSALQTCRNWLHIIANEPRFWHRLHLPLHSFKSLRRASRFAKFAKLCTSKARLERLEISHSADYIDEEMQGRLHDDLYNIIRHLRHCCSRLGTLDIEIGGRDPEHLQLLYGLLQYLAAPISEDSESLLNVRHLRIDVPAIRGFQIKEDCLCLFQALDSLKIVSGQPILWAPAEPPTLPSVPACLVLLHQNRDKAMDVYGCARLYQAETDYKEARRQHGLAQQAFIAQNQQNGLDGVWELFAAPLDEDDRPLQFENAPSTLTRIDLKGCYLHPSIKFPSSGFPHLRVCVLNHCKLGRSIYRFLSLTPSLAELSMDTVFRDLGEELALEQAQVQARSQAQEGAQAASPAASVARTLVMNDLDAGCDVIEIHLSPPVESARLTSLALRGGGDHVGSDDLNDLASDLEPSEYSGSIDSSGPWGFPDVLLLPQGVSEDWRVVQEEEIDSNGGYQITLCDPNDQKAIAQFRCAVTWQTLLQRREQIRKYWDRAVRDAPEYVAEQAASAPVITLAHLESLRLAGEETPLIWTNVLEPGLRRRPPLHPVVHMPNLVIVDLSNNYGLNLRTAGPITDDRLLPPTLQYSGDMSEWEFDYIMDDFIKGREPVPFEPNDDELLETMSEEDYEYYTEHMWKMRNYRWTWRHQQGFYRNGWPDERRIWQLVTGQDTHRIKPHALTVLAAASPKIKHLDLSYSSVNKGAFTGAMPFFRNLEKLALRGTEGIEDWTLKELPMTCPKLADIDVRTSALSVCGVAPLVHGLRETSNGGVQLKVRVDDPDFCAWEAKDQYRQQANVRTYKYLAFIDALVDEDADAWRQAQKAGRRFSTKRMKQRMQ